MTRRFPFRLRFPVVALIVACLMAGMATGARAAWRSEGPFVGRIADVAFDPHRPGTAYAASDNGGVFQSDDGGKTWAHAGGPKTGNRIAWLEVDPGTPGTLWVGVDNPGNPALWRSRDRGASWQLVTDSYRGELRSLHPVGYRIAFAPSKPSDVWVPSSSLHFRSRDGGKSWTDFRVPGMQVETIAVDPKNPDLIYAGGHGGEASHLARSEDGGKTWRGVGSGLEPTLRDLRIDPINPSTLFAVSGFHKLFRSDDRGATFREMSSPVSGTGDITSLRFEPGSSKNLWMASESGLFRSTNGGESWSPADRDTGRYLVRAVAFDPRDVRSVLAASSGGGLFRSEDSGSSWTSASTGVAAGWTKRLYATPRSDVVFAQMATGLFRREQGRDWTELGAPFEETDAVELDGVVFDRQNAEIVWAHDSSSIWQSVDGGRRFRALERKEPSLRELMKASISSAEFLSLAQDPGNPKMLYAGSWSNDGPGEAVFKTTDGGKTWKPSGIGLPAENVRLLRSETPSTVFAIVERALFRTTNAGASWTRADSGLPAVDLRVLVIDPSLPSRLFVATEQGLFRSTDSGESWTKLGSALAEEDIEAVVVAPDGRVFAGSFRGGFQSRDGGTTWTTMNDGLSQLDVRALAISGPAPALRLWAGTAGGSVFSTEIP